MTSKLACIILVSSFLSVANSIKCYVCGSLTASCEEGVTTYCDGAGCAKFFAEAAGRKVIIKYCDSGSEGCISSTIATFSGTLCHCSSNYCNQSSRNPRPFPAMSFAVVWLTLKVMT